MRRTLIVAAGLLVADVGLAVAMLAPAWAHPTAVTVGRRTDAPYTVWALAWVARAVTHGLSPLTTHGLSWPAGVNLMTNATVPGLGVVLTPLTRALGPLVSFDVAATAALALTAWSAQLVLIRTGRLTWPAAAVGGLVAGFAPLALNQEAGAHLHVTAAFLVPPLLLGVGRLVSGTARHPGRWGVAIGLLAAAQLLIGEELLAITVIAAALAVVATAVSRPVPWREVIQALAVSAVVFVLCAAWPLWVQFAGPGHIVGPIQHGIDYPNDLTSLVVPSRPTWLTAGWASAAPSSEGGVYLGAPLVLVAVVMAWRRWRDPLVRVVAVTAAAVFVLSLGDKLAVGGALTAIPMPWALFGHLPVLDSLIPVRFGVVLDLAFGGLLALGLDAAWVARARRHAAGPRRGARLAATVAVGAASVLPIVPALPFPTSRWAIPAFFRGVPAVPDGALVMLAPYPGVRDPAPEMWLAVAGARWRSAGGGYFVPGPGGRVTIGGPAPAGSVMEARLEAGGTVTGAERAAVLAELRRDRVAVVIIGPVDNRLRVLAFWRGLLGPPVDTGGMTVFLV